jgi:(R,R)-butanediol dehydrogenase / meso-butanediol dehydrogenase / diacetyl reductase
VRAVAIAEDRTLQPITMEERELGPNEARVAVAFCGICGSDLHLRHSPAVAAGSVMGHEFSGTVSELGAAVEGVSIDDRVAVYPFVACGECPNCRRGDLHVCLNAAVTGLGLGMNPGGYAESVVVDASMLVPLPDGLSMEHGALVEPLAVGLHGIDLGEAKAGDACAVIGAGPIGVVTALGLKARGIDRVVVVEKNERRQERMRSLGIDAVGLDDVHMRVVAALGGEPPDVVFECAGNPAAPQLAAELVRSKGIVVLLGVLEEPVEISQLVLIVKEAQMRAAFAYTRKNFDDAVQLLAAGRVPADSLITGTAPLERAQEMFERLESPVTRDLKILLSPAG